MDFESGALHDDRGLVMLDGGARVEGQLVSNGLNNEAHRQRVGVAMNARLRAFSSWERCSE